MKGKIGYMSPEHCRGEEVDRRSDIFSLGVMLFELTTCERLFFADNDFAVLNKVICGEFDRPSQRVPGYPPALEKIVLRALAPDPAARYQSADEVRRDLQGLALNRRIELGGEVVADWLAQMFGAPPYPRVEARPAADALDENAPTLVLVDDAPTVARVEAPSAESLGCPTKVASTAMARGGSRNRRRARGGRLGLRDPRCLCGRALPAPDRGGRARAGDRRRPVCERSGGRGPDRRARADGERSGRARRCRCRVTDDHAPARPGTHKLAGPRSSAWSRSLARRAADITEATTRPRCPLPRQGLTRAAAVCSRPCPGGRRSAPQCS